MIFAEVSAYSGISTQGKAGHYKKKKVTEIVWIGLDCNFALQPGPERRSLLPLLRDGGAAHQWT